MKTIINEMFKIEGINENEVEVYYNETETKLMVKNTNKDIDLYDLLKCYLEVESINYIQQFVYLHNYNDCEIMEVILK